MNISTRALVETGDEVMIGGFIVRDEPRLVLIQAVGPELGAAGIENALVDPVLTITNTTDPLNPVALMVNDNWEDSQGPWITDIWGDALPLMAGSLSSAAVLTLQPGNYTAKVEGKNGTSGVALVEAYRIDSSGSDGEFVNISTRALVGTGAEVMIGGFIIRDGPRQVLIQAVGPELGASGIENALVDPVLTITETSDPLNPEEVAVNDNWEDSQGEWVTEIWGGAPPLAAGSLSSAAVLTLQPGNYTAKVEGQNGATGVALVEVYGIDSGREALMALYESTDGVNWARSDNWGTDAPLEEWHGVTTDERGRVVGLDLSGNQLSGPIPAELGDLSNLEVLWLYDNDLSGGIPAELGNLGNLEVLWLYSNRLSGEIPAELGNLGNLQDLDFFDNQLSGEIPAELGNLSRLESLWLSANRLSGGIPAELGNLGNLRSLLLDDNRLSGEIPAELGNLRGLRDLWLSYNQLGGSLPAELGNLGNLQALLVDNNQLSGGVPAELGNLVNLEDLWLANNGLSGGIPLSLVGTALKALWYEETGLCLPMDAALRAWVQALDYHAGNGRDC